MAAGDPFDFVGDSDGHVGVVCIHGFTGTPYEMRYLGDALARAGVTARGLLLPGHGTSVDDLEQTRWQDWVGAVEREVEDMFRRCRHVAVVGQSLGGLLALHVAAHRTDLACAVTLAAPLWLGRVVNRVAHWLTGPLASRVRRLPKLGGSDVRDPAVRAENPGYDAIPTRALGELLAFMRVVEGVLPAVAPPVLVLHGRRDHTAPVACAARIAELTRARRVRILPRSFHLIASDVERDIVAGEVIGFIHSTTNDQRTTTKG